MIDGPYILADAFAEAALAAGAAMKTACSFSHCLLLGQSQLHFFKIPPPLRRLSSRHIRPGFSGSVLGYFQMFPSATRFVRQHTPRGGGPRKIFDSPRCSPAALGHGAYHRIRSCNRIPGGKNACLRGGETRVHIDRPRPARNQLFSEPGSRQRRLLSNSNNYSIRRPEEL